MIATPDTDQLLTVRQAATLLHLDERTVQNHINGGRLPARKLPGGKGWLIRRADLFTSLQDLPSPHRSSDPQPSVVEAKNNFVPLEVDSGIIRRTHTPEGRAHAIAMLRRLRAGDTQEQTEVWSTLKTALDEDRLSYRKLFPEHETSTPETHPGSEAK
jgi:excisionase family DNA binding protein